MKFPGHPPFWRREQKGPIAVIYRELKCGTLSRCRNARLLLAHTADLYKQEQSDFEHFDQAETSKRLKAISRNSNDLIKLLKPWSDWSDPLPWVLFEEIGDPRPILVKLHALAANAKSPRGPVPNEPNVRLIRRLASIYKRFTGKKAGRSTYNDGRYTYQNARHHHRHGKPGGPFNAFVASFLTLIGEPWSPGQIDRAIRDMDKSRSSDT